MQDISTNVLHGEIYFSITQQLILKRAASDELAQNGVGGDY